MGTKDRNPDIPMWLDKIFRKTNLKESQIEEYERYQDSPYMCKVYGWRAWFSQKDNDD